MAVKLLYSSLIAAASLPALAQQDMQADSARVIISLEHAWGQSVTRNDNRALDELFDNALVVADNGGTMTKGEYLSTIRTRGPDSPHFALEKASVRMFENTAIVVGVYSEGSTIRGRTTLRYFRFVDTWVKEKDRWLLVAGIVPSALKKAMPTSGLEFVAFGKASRQVAHRPTLVLRAFRVTGVGRLQNW